MQKTLIHVGYPKTATTWFIRNFYPRVKNADKIFFKDIEFDLSQGNQFFRIKKDLSLQQKEILIVASNAFSGLFNFEWNNGGNRDYFIENLKKNFPRSSVILFVRNQLDFIASGYSTYLTHGGTYTFDKLFKPGLMDGGLFPLEYLNYSTAISIFQKNFGEENVHVYIYEELLEDNDVFLKKFTEAHGLEINMKEVNSGKSNEKLRIGLANLLRFANKFVKKGAAPKKYYFNVPFFRNFLLKRIDRLNSYRFFGGRINVKALLSKEQEGILKNYFRSSNQELVQKYHMEEIKKYDYPL